MRIRHTSNNGWEGEATTAVCGGGGEGDNCLDLNVAFSVTDQCWYFKIQHNTMNMTSKRWAMTYATASSNLTDVVAGVSLVCCFFRRKRLPSSFMSIFIFNIWNASRYAYCLKANFHISKSIYCENKLGLCLKVLRFVIWVYDTRSFFFRESFI